jgi:transcriptional regulator with XRE-family HTH domain
MIDREHSGARPYELLGNHLKQFREQKRESLLEASGAVEIDAELLERYENGQERPSEDILMLLINHFDVKDHEAVKAWESAGYESADHSGNLGRRQLDGLEKAAVLVLAMDARTIYSDGVLIDGNNSGLVMNFTQATGLNRRQQQTIARIGMSYEQAEQVLASLQQALLYGKQTGKPRRLPPPRS